MRYPAQLRDKARAMFKAAFHASAAEGTPDREREMQSRELLASALEAAVYAAARDAIGNNNTNNNNSTNNNNKPKSHLDRYARLG